MADITLTIGETSKTFELAKKESVKQFFSKEEPIIPIRALADVPSYGDLPPDKILAFVQDNWRGGMGQKNRFRFMDMFADGQNIDSRDPNQFFLGPLIDTILLKDAVDGSTTTDTILFYQYFSGTEFIASTDYVYKRRVDGTTFERVLSPASDVTGLIQYDGNLYCALDGTSNKYQYTSDGTNWTLCTLANAYANQIMVAPPFSGSKDVLVIATQPNIIRTSIDPVNAGAGWLDPPYYVGDEASDITGLMVVNGTLIIAKEDGFYALPADGRPIPLTPEFKNKRNATNGKYWTIWQGILYASLAGDIVEIMPKSDSSYTFDYMGPLELSPDLATTGSVQSITSDDKNLYAVMKSGTNYTIYAGRERFDEKQGLRWEWTPHINLDTNACNMVGVMQRASSNPNIWYAYGTTMASSILADSPNNPLGDSNYRFCTQGYLITTYFDAGYATWSKIFYQLWTIAANLTSGITIEIYYQLDTDTTWTPLTTIRKNGVQSVDLNALSCQKIRLKIELNSNDSSVTPILREFIYRGVLQPEVTRMLDFTVLLSQSTSRKVSSDLSFLVSGRTTTVPITLKDNRFGTTKPIIFLPNSPMEIEAIDEASKQPSYQARIVAQELNWIKPE